MGGGQTDPQVPVYQVKPVVRNGPVRSLHRNMLRPCIWYSEDELGGSLSPIIPPVIEPPQPMWGYLFPQDVGEAVPALRRSNQENQGRLPARYLE